MKRVMSLAVVSVLLLGAGFAIYHFSGARGKVAKQKALDTIDGWLGKERVVRQEIVDALDGLDKAIGKLNHAKHSAKVEVEALDKDIQKADTKVTEKRKDLVKLREHIKKYEADSQYTVSFGGKPQTKSDVEKLADKASDEFEALVKERDGLVKVRDTQDNTFKTMEQKEAKAKNTLKVLKVRLRELDAKIAAMEAQREATAALNETDRTFAEGMTGIETKFKELEKNVEVKFRVEDEKFRELSEKGDVEDTATAINGSKEILNRLDKLIGDSK